MSSYAQMLEMKYSDNLDTNANHYIGYIVEGSRRLEALIQGMLTFSRVANVDNVPVTRVSLDTVVAWARQNLEAAIQESEATIDAAPLGTIMGNQLQLVQLFQNLIGNAISHRQPGIPPKIHIQAERRAGSVVITVQDNGPGIEARYFEHIFGVFKRLNRETPGTGIGLALCKRIVEKHHGRIWVESEPGQGARFIVSLPGDAEAATSAG
jgi:light-regulated signal transduction histidine kinase (bacteriophytochrome)